jgi:hypothetical protein
MKKRLSFATSVLILCGGFALAQKPVQTPQPGRAPAHPNAHAANPQAAPTPGRLTPQMLGEMLRAATTFHELAQNLNIGKLLGPDQHVAGPDGQLHHSMERTAQTVGAGAGAGAAIGAMTHSQNGVLIGALIGAGSGMILDQILKAREDQRSGAANAAAPNIGYAPEDQQLKLRTQPK